MNKKSLKNFCSINMGQSPKSTSYNQDGNGLPFYQGNADFGKMHPKTRFYCDSPIKIANKNDILISVRAPIGALNIALNKCCIGRGLAALTPMSNCNMYYLFYALSSSIDKLQCLGTGSTFKAITKSTLENLQIPYRQNDEQIKIANIFLKLDTLIQKRNIQLEKLDQLVLSRFIELFGDPVQNPKNWEIRRYEDISLIITDGEHSTPKRVSEKGIYLLSARNILNHSLQLDDVDFIDEIEYNRIAKRIVPKEKDLLISCSGSIGRICVVPKNLKFQMVRSVALLRLKHFINPIYMEYLFTTKYTKNQIKKLATMSSQANLFQGKIKKLTAIIPPIEIQNDFADFVQQINKSKVEIQKSLDKLEILKKSLMQQYFG